MKSCTLLGITALLTTASCWAVDATLVADTYITSANPGANSGALPTLNVGSGAITLLNFSLGPLPSGLSSSSIVKANLILYANRVAVAGNVAVAPVLGPWTELAVTFGTNPGMGPSVASVDPCHPDRPIHRRRRHLSRARLGH